MSENRYGEKREESETGMKLQNCETQESENKIQESTNEQIKDMGQVVLNSNSRKHKVELLTIIGEVKYRRYIETACFGLLLSDMYSL